MEIRPVTKQADNYLYLERRLSDIIFNNFEAYELVNILELSHSAVYVKRKKNKLKPKEIVRVINHLAKRK